MKQQKRPARLTPGMMAEQGRLDVMWQSLVADLDAAKDVIARIDKVLRVPAAEYVPAIRDAFDIIDAWRKRR